MVMLRAGSREYLVVRVKVEGEVPSDPTVAVAIVPRNTSPVSEDWRPVASFEDGEARFLVTAVPGRFDVFIRVTDFSEAPVLYAGRLEVR